MSNSETKVVIFLQNMWFKDPVRMKQQLDVSFKGNREKFIRTWLFWSCKTGEALQRSFGDAVIGHAGVVFEEQSPEMGDCASSAFPPDHDHIQAVLDKHKPVCVVALGNMAARALQTIRDTPLIDSSGHRKFHFITGPHPAARGRGVGDELIRIGDEIRRVLYT